MTNPKPLHGTSKDAYFRRVLRAEPGVGAAASARILRRLSAEVVQVRLRDGTPVGAIAVGDRVPAPAVVAASPAMPAATAPAAAATPAAAAAPTCAAAPVTAREAAGPAPVTAAEVLAATGGTPAFDPYSPNVVVVLRTGGRERALAALSAIERAADLRHLAREQQLSIDEALDAPADIRVAIVAAAERRVANRRAAAG